MDGCVDRLGLLVIRAVIDSYPKGLLIRSHHMTSPRCAFCERSISEVKRIISSPDRKTYICDQCAAVCAEIAQRPLSSMDDKEAQMPRKTGIIQRLVGKRGHS
jgi:ribosomal protein L37AE/L43A